MKRREDPDFFEDAETGGLKIVLRAVGLLALIFMGAGVWLYINLLTPAQVEGFREPAQVRAVLRAYHGPLWGVEAEREKVRQALVKEGMAAGGAVTVFPTSPAHLRLIAVDCRIGFLFPESAARLGAGLQVETLRPGRCLVVRVGREGNGTGNAAYRAAARYLKNMKSKPGEGERVEIKVRAEGRSWVEHLIPVTADGG